MGSSEDHAVAGWNGHAPSLEAPFPPLSIPPRTRTRTRGFVAPPPGHPGQSFGQLCEFQLWFYDQIWTVASVAGANPLPDPNFGS